MGLAAAQESAPETVDAASAVSTDEALAVMPDWPVPEPVDFVCPFKGEFDYEPGEISCGFIAVPEKREDPDSRTIRLHFVRIAATGEESEYRADPVIYLTGGPGVGVNSYAKRLREHAILAGPARSLYPRAARHRGQRQFTNENVNQPTFRATDFAPTPCHARRETS